VTITDKFESSNSITVVLCTYNRCGDLLGALESLASSQLPDSLNWEVLVVDNNSTDQTHEVVEGFCQRHPGRFRYLFESQAGKSFALNAGIANARGSILAFMDDDAMVTPVWLRNLTAPLQHNEWAGSAGRILPAEKFTPPSWLPDDLVNWGGILCAYFDLGDDPCELHRAPYGVNMAFRREIFEKYGGFRTDLGPRPGSQIRNEDTEFGRRLLAAGERLRYEPSAVVYHPVPQGRITQEYFFSWWYDYGQAMIRELGPRPNLLGIPRDYWSLLRSGVEVPHMVLLWLFSTNPQKRFMNRCWICHQAGQFIELYRRCTDRQKITTVAQETKNLS
jgi:glycosyltransferase involved in cell wall biosynthesis